jgi:hypothetical protein
MKIFEALCAVPTMGDPAWQATAYGRRSAPASPNAIPDRWNATQRGDRSRARCTFVLMSGAGMTGVFTRFRRMSAERRPAPVRLRLGWVSPINRGESKLPRRRQGASQETSAMECEGKQGRAH